MFPKNRIHLSRYLQAQTTPYPEAGRFLKRGIFLTVILLGAGIFLSVRTQKPTSPLEPKQILGEQEKKAAEFLIYEIKKGDTLFNLSQRFGISWQTMAELNQLAEPFILKTGQTLKIPTN